MLQVAGPEQMADVADGLERQLLQRCVLDVQHTAATEGLGADVRLGDEAVGRGVGAEFEQGLERERHPPLYIEPRDLMRRAFSAGPECESPHRT